MRFVVVAVMLAAILVGCGKQSLEGEWTNGDGAIAFAKNSTLILREKSLNVTGKWDLIDGDRVTMQFSGLMAFAGAEVCKYRFDSDQLVLSDCAFAGRFKRKT